MSIHTHDSIEAGILIRDLRAFGFDLELLTKTPMFRIALREYGSCRLSFDGLVDICEKLTIFNPKIKEPPLKRKERP